MPIENPLGDVEITPCLAPTTPTAPGEATLRRGVLSAGRVGSFHVNGEPFAVRCGRPVDALQVVLGRGDRGSSSRSLDRVRFDGVLGFGDGASGIGEQLAEPVRNLTTAGLGAVSTAALGRWRLLGGEVAALRDGGDVGPVNSEDAFEDVAGLGDVVRLGDDTDQVLLAATGDPDVQAATCRCC